MYFIRLFKDQVNTQQKRYSAIITLIICLITITPLCGFFFECGCDWPWFGLDSKCNVFQPKSVHQCPWCASLFTGILVSGVAIIAAVCVSVFSIQTLADHHPVEEVLIRILFALSTFFLLAFIMAILTAFWQGYPLPNYYIKVK